MKIALIDDHPIIIEGYKSILISKEIESEENIAILSSLAEAYAFIKENAENQVVIDLFVIDYNMPENVENNLYNGEDLAHQIRHYLPNAKIVLLTSIATPILLFEIIQRLQPEGLWLKSDIGMLIFLNHTSSVLSGKTVYSESVNKAYRNVVNYTSILDETNRKILLLLNDGIKTKNLPDYLNLSIDTINHRKSNLKILLGLDKSDDFELLQKAKMLGLL